MNEHNKHQILLLGLDNRLLWQLTRILSLMEDQIEFHCIQDPSEAKTVCEQKEINLIVVDEWEGALQTSEHLDGDNVFESGRWKWIVLVDTIPLECLPNGNIPSPIIFLEKPFNPKEASSIFLKVLEGQNIQEETLSVPAFSTNSFHLTLGEQYCTPDTLHVLNNGADEEPVFPQQHAEQDIDSNGNNEFYCLLDMGFACLKLKNWDGAKKHWSKAQEIRPFDQRLQLNLKRLAGFMHSPS